MEAEAAVEQAGLSDSDKTQSDEVVKATDDVDLDDMLRLTRLLADSSRLAQKVIERSQTKDVQLRRASSLIEGAEAAHKEAAWLRGQDSLKGVLGYDPVEAKTELEERHRKLQEDYCSLQDTLKEKERLTQDLAAAKHANKQIQAESKVKLEAARKEHDKLSADFEGFKAASVEEVAKLKADVEGAKNVSAQLMTGIEPILDEFFPDSVGAHGQDSAKAIDLLQSVPKKMKSLVSESAHLVCRHTLALTKSFYPNIILELIEAGFAAGTTADSAAQLLDEHEGLSRSIVKDVIDSDSEKSDEEQA
uniref:Uncharacterized protein n=1 Tax=Leersia perrieri TaxID=77586 RepID=A0A0D9XPR8_9ORYZ